MDDQEVDSDAVAAESTEVTNQFFKISNIKALKL